MTDASHLTNATIPEMLSVRQTDLNLSDEAITHALGYTNATVVAMIKNGTIRLPINKAQDFAKALELDAGTVMRALLRGIDPGLLQAVEQCLAPLALTPSEARLITRLRSGTQTPEVLSVMTEKDAS